MDTLIHPENTWGLMSVMMLSVAAAIYLEQRYTWASLVGAFVFCTLRFTLGVEADSWLAFLLVLLTRLAAIHWNWSLYHPRPPRRHHKEE